MANVGPEPLSTAAVPGFSALALRAVVRRYVDELPPGRFHPDLMWELRRTAAAIEEVADRWTTWRASADGSVSAGLTEVVAELPREITTAAAGDLLGVGPRRVIQLIRGGQLVARRVRRSWWVDRESVVVLTEARRSVA